MTKDSKQNRWARIEGQLVGEGGPLRETERLVFENLFAAQRRLDQLDKVVQTEGVTVTGSTGQVRPHPLLAEQRALRAEIAAGIESLRRERETTRLLEEANAMTCWTPSD